MPRGSTSENLIKLRALTEKICETPQREIVENLIGQIKEIIDHGQDTVSKTKSLGSKIKCYEEICDKITNILTDIEL